MAAPAGGAWCSGKSDFNSVHAPHSSLLTPRLAQLASQLRCQLVTRLTVCSSNSTFYWFLFCCGHGSLHDTSHSSHVGLIRTGITRHTEDVPLLAHRVRALAGARAGEWERPEAPRAAGPGGPAPHTPREIRGKKGTGTSLIMWTDNTNNFYPSTIQIISSGPGHVREIIGYGLGLQVRQQATARPSPVSLFGK